MVGTYDYLGQRGGKGNPALGRPGELEEGLSGYSGLRVKSVTYLVGGTPGVSAITGTGIVNVQNPGVGTQLAIVVNAAGVARTRMPVPMALVWQYNAAAGGGTRQVRFRILGLDQFRQPIYEDAVGTFAAGSGASAVLNLTRIFSAVTAVNILERTNVPASGDTVLIDFLVASNPKFGLPIRVGQESDVLGVTIHIPAGGTGVFLIDVGQTAGTGLVVDVVNCAVTLTGIGAFVTDIVVSSINILCRTSLPFVSSTLPSTTPGVPRWPKAW